jgi:hypothetical protein
MASSKKKYASTPEAQIANIQKNLLSLANEVMCTMEVQQCYILWHTRALATIPVHTSS